MAGKESILLLSDPLDALACRLSLIRQAKESIKIQTFIWGEDALSFLMLSELKRAAERGVRVQLLIDGWIGVDHPLLLKVLKKYSTDIESKHYNPPSKVICPSVVRLLRASINSFSRLNHRMHAKSFIVDDAWCILGGRNYEDKYFGLDDDRFFRDREILFFGASSKKVSNIFTEFWSNKLSISTKELKYVFSSDEPHGKFERFYHVSLPNEAISDLASVNVEAFLEKFSSFRFLKYFLKHRINCDKQIILWDSPDNDTDKISESASQLVDLISTSQSPIILQTPYLLFDSQTLEHIRQAGKGNKPSDIILITNGFFATDNIVAHLLGLRDRCKFTQGTRCKVFETKELPVPELSSQPKGSSVCNHSKTLIVGGETAYVGSSNFDPRSHYYNSEIGILLRGSIVTESIKNDVMSDIEFERARLDSCKYSPLHGNNLLRVFKTALNSGHPIRNALRTVAYLLQVLIPSSLKRLF